MSETVERVVKRPRKSKTETPDLLGEAPAAERVDPAVEPSSEHPAPADIAGEAQQVASTEPYGSALVSAVIQNPVILLTDPAKADPFFAAIEAEVLNVPVDLSTVAGREAIASAAFKVARTKITIDKAGKTLTEEWRIKTKAVNDARKPLWDRFEALQARVRGPLTEWEKAEDARKKWVEDEIGEMERAINYPLGAASEVVQDRLNEIAAADLTDPRWGDAVDRAGRARAAAIDQLTAAVARLKQAEADAAEMAVLRADKAKRDAEDAERQRVEEERAAAERQAREAEDSRQRAEQEAAERAQREQERIAREREEAAAQAQRDAEQRAEEARQAEADRIEAERAEERRQAQAALDEANRQREEAEQRERDAQAQRERAERERRQEEAAAADAQRKRDADRAHTAAVLKLAKEAIMEHGWPEKRCGEPDPIVEETARAIVLAIRAGLIPNVSLRF